MTNPDPLRLVDACYAAALDASLWPGVLEQVSACLGARGTVIVSYDPRRTADTLHSDSLREVHDAYSGGWWEHDSRIARARGLGMRPGLVVADAMLFTPEDKRKDPFFQDFCAKHGLDELVAFFAPDPGGGLMTVSALREAAKAISKPGRSPCSRSWGRMSRGPSTSRRGSASPTGRRPISARPWRGQRSASSCSIGVAPCGSSIPVPRGWLPVA